MFGAGGNPNPLVALLDSIAGGSAAWYPYVEPVPFCRLAYQHVLEPVLLASGA